jgi:hypothetical protein
VSAAPERNLACEAHRRAVEGFMHVASTPKQLTKQGLWRRRYFPGERCSERRRRDARLAQREGERKRSRNAGSASPKNVKPRDGAAQKRGAHARGQESEHCGNLQSLNTGSGLSSALSVVRIRWAVSAELLVSSSSQPAAPGSLDCAVALLRLRSR